MFLLSQQISQNHICIHTLVLYTNINQLGNNNGWVYTQYCTLIYTNSYTNICTIHICGWETLCSSNEWSPLAQNLHLERQISSAPAQSSGWRQTSGCSLWVNYNIIYTYIYIYNGKTIGKPQENHRKMMVSWDLMVFYPLVFEHS